MRKDSVFLTQPNNGQVHAPSALAFHCASTRGRQVLLHMSVGSMFCFNFNKALADAQGMPENERPEYFAMIHADVWSEPGWIDVLVDELEAARLDVLSCVVPFRTGSGLTSTSLLVHEKYRRLTLQELFSTRTGPAIPPTFRRENLAIEFGIEDATHTTLLINTGMWVARTSAIKGIWFHVHDYAVSVNGTMVPRYWPEDWGFSEDCAARGLQVGATTKTRVWHGDQLHTYGAYGMPHDEWHER